MSGRDGGDDDIFSRFNGFFGTNMDDQFREMSKKFEEIFQQMGIRDIVIHEGPAHPQLPAGIGRPPNPQDPRDQMLKNPEKEPCQTGCAPSQQEIPPNRTQGFPNFFGFPPFERPGGGRPGFDDRLSPQEMSSPTIQSSSFVSSWSSSSTNDGSRWNKTVVRTVRNPDGSIEKIETHTKNGQTCTTTTKTDPYGAVTTNTVCDKSSIEGPPLKDKDSPSGPVTPSMPPVYPYQPSNNGYSEEDNSFFRKLFGFKPKDK